MLEKRLKELANQSQKGKSEKYHFQGGPVFTLDLPAVA